MANPLHPLYIFPENQQVEDWYNNLQTVGYLPKYKKYLPIRDSTAVVALYFCKENKNLKHEYIVADLRRPDGEYLHAIVDRSGSDVRPENSELRAQRASERKNEDLANSPQASNSSLSSFTFLETLHRSSDDTLDRLQKPSRANDRIQFVAGRFSPPSHSVIKQYDFRADTQPSLVQLAIAAIVARKYDRYYSLFRHQCYWYADCVCVVMEEVVGEGNFTIATDKARSRGRDEDQVYLGADELKQLRSSSTRRRRHTANCEISDAIEVDDDQWSKLEPGTHTFKIFTRRPAVVRRLRESLNRVTEEWNQSDNERREEEERRIQDREGRQKAEQENEDLKKKVQEVEDLKKRVRELEAVVAQQQSTSNGIVNGAVPK